MGCCCGKDAPTKQIEKGMLSDHKVDKLEKKLLLLGAGETGKSTLLKGLKKSRGDPIVDEHMITETAYTVRSCLIAEMVKLLGKSEQLYNQDREINGECNLNTEDSEIVKAIQLVADFNRMEFSVDSNFDDEKLVPLGEALSFLWSLDPIQATFARRGGNFSFPDNMEYWYASVERVMRTDYVPTEEDIIKARVRTTGVITYIYEGNTETGRGSTVFSVTDVGGQRSERKKWIFQFDDVHAVLYVVALNHYHSLLYEDEGKNAMHESIEIFHETVNMDYFESSELILFLNKSDLFQDLLRDEIPLSVCFSSENKWDDEQWTGPDWHPLTMEEYLAIRQQGDDGGDSSLAAMDDDESLQMELREKNNNNFYHCREAAIQFIKGIFEARNDNKLRILYTHVTCATDSDSVGRIFWDVQNIIIRANLKKGGLMSTDMHSGNAQASSFNPMRMGNPGGGGGGGGGDRRETSNRKPIPFRQNQFAYERQSDGNASIISLENDLHE